VLGLRVKRTMWFTKPNQTNPNNHDKIKNVYRRFHSIWTSFLSLQARNVHNGLIQANGVSCAPLSQLQTKWKKKVKTSSSLHNFCPASPLNKCALISSMTGMLFLTIKTKLVTVAMEEMKHPITKKLYRHLFLQSLRYTSSIASLQHSLFYTMKHGNLQNMDQVSYLHVHTQTMNLITTFLLGILTHVKVWLGLVHIAIDNRTKKRNQKRVWQEGT